MVPMYTATYALSEVRLTVHAACFVSLPTVRTGLVGFYGNSVRSS